MALPEGLWGLIGSVVGTAGTLLTTAFTNWLTRDHTVSEYDRRVKALLSQLLSDGEWHPLTTLAAITGGTIEDTREYLILIDARADVSNPAMWGLIRYHPLG